MSSTANALESIEKIMGLASTGLDLSAKASDLTGRAITTHKTSILVIIGILVAICLVICCLSICSSLIAGGGLLVIGGKKKGHPAKK